MSKNYTITMYNGQKVRAYSFDDLFDTEYEVVVCPTCESYTEPESLESASQDDIFGGMFIVEVLRCRVCGETFKTSQHFTSDQMAHDIPF